MGKEADKPMKKAGHDKNCTCTKGAEISLRRATSFDSAAAMRDKYKYNPVIKY